MNILIIYMYINNIFFICILIIYILYVIYIIKYIMMMWYNLLVTIYQNA